MRILLIHSFYRRSMPSGENDAVESQAELLRQSGYDVMLWGPTSGESIGAAEAAGTGIRIVLGRGASPQEVIQSFDPHIIHVHNIFPNIGLRWMVQQSVPIVLSIHNYRTVCANGVLTRQQQACTRCLTASRSHALWNGCYRGSRLATAAVLSHQNLLRRSIRRDIAKVIYTSPLSKQVLDPLLQPHDSAVIPNYVPSIFKYEASEPRPKRRFFLVAGRLTPEKGVVNLVKDWPSGERLVVIGDGPERSILEKLAEGRSVELKGFVSPDDRTRFMREATALILPSLTKEADPLVVAQALSAGTPCVVADTTASARLGGTSLGVRAYGDAQALSSCLDGLDHVIFRQAARDLYQKQWSAEAWMQRYRSEVLAQYA